MTGVCDDDVYSPQHTMCVCVYSCVSWHARSIEDRSLRILCVAVVVIGVTLEEHALPSWYGTTTPVYVPLSPRHEKPTAFLPAQVFAGLEWATCPENSPCHVSCAHTPHLIVQKCKYKAENCFQVKKSHRSVAHRLEDKRNRRNAPDYRSKGTTGARKGCNWVVRRNKIDLAHRFSSHLVCRGRDLLETLSRTAW